MVRHPGERLQLRLDYRPDLFERAERRGAGGRLVRLLGAAVADPGRAIGRLEMLSAAERRTILQDVERHRACGCAATLPELFAAQAARTPGCDRGGVRGRAAELPRARRARQPAGASSARARGRPRDRGRAVRRALAEMLVGLLGILKAGGAYLPLDPGYPAERLAFMLDDAAAPAAGHPGGAAGRLPAPQARVLLDADWPAIARQPEPAPRPRPRARTLAYVIYTSGSTGTPKASWSRTAALSNLLPR